MIVWIWDADGPVRAGSGVTDSEAAARLTAETFMRTARATAARVEKATMDVGRTITCAYIPTGFGWTATQSAGQVTWVPFGDPLAPP